MSETYLYKKRSITVSARPRKQTEKTIWAPEVFIDESMLLFSPLSKYPPKTFSTPEAAIEYGKEAAGYKIDDVPAVGKFPKKLL
jgi:hypothetical protein